jgi:hypothetical protein
MLSIGERPLLECLLALLVVADGLVLDDFS